MIEQIKLERFTAFESLTLAFSPGINIAIGENGTGKTHFLKAVYAACDVSRGQKSLAEKVCRVFLPSGEQAGRLVKRKAASGGFAVTRRVAGLDHPLTLRLDLSANDVASGKVLTARQMAAKYGQEPAWQAHPVESVYIPVKDMMANAPGFRSLYSLRHIHFEEVYADIVDRAFLAPLRDQPDAARKRILALLQQAMDGKVVAKNEEFFLKNAQGELEFTLLAEGIRKLGLLWLLVQNGSVRDGAVLLWDEPEANLNPKLMRTVVEVLLALQRMGVQVFLATHSYAVLKEFDLQAGPEDRIRFHSLYRNKETGEVAASWAEDYAGLAPNAIDDSYGSFVDREIARTMGGLGK